MCAYIHKILCTKKGGGTIWSQRQFNLFEENT